MGTSFMLENRVVEPGLIWCLSSVVWVQLKNWFLQYLQEDILLNYWKYIFILFFLIPFWGRKIRILKYIRDTSLLKAVLTFYLNSLLCMYFLVEKCYLQQATEILSQSHSKSRAIIISFIFYYIPFNTAKCQCMYYIVFPTWVCYNLKNIDTVKRKIVQWTKPVCSCYCNRTHILIFSYQTPSEYRLTTEREFVRYPKESALIWFHHCCQRHENIVNIKISPQVAFRISSEARQK